MSYLKQVFLVDALEFPEASVSVKIHHKVKTLFQLALLYLKVLRNLDLAKISKTSGFDDIKND
jgi:hypothetical protein